MKNLKIAKKLLISFVLVIALAIAVGVVGIIGMADINEGSTTMYQYQTRPLPFLADSIEYIQELRMLAKELEVIVMLERVDQIPDVLRRISGARAELVNNLESFDRTITAGSRAEVLFRDAMNTLNNIYLPFLDNAARLATAGDLESLVAATDTADISAAGAVDNLNDIMQTRVNEASAANADNAALYQLKLTTIIIVLVASIVVAVVMALVVSRSICKPLKEYDSWMRMTAKGDIVWKPEKIAILDRYKERKDEIGTLVCSYVELLDYMNTICDDMQKVAQGNLDFEVTPHSELDMLAINLKKMVEDLNAMFEEIGQASHMVYGSSGQIADGAQSLAQGSTEQAATVQQLSAAISEIARKTKDNAEMADRAAVLAGTIKHSAEMGSAQMDEMMVAVKEINQASQSISKVIKVIDDIAFQTNILALNAAVEAARAGQHGKGFAVVAEEVRNLAAKSAEAAKDTGGLIASSMEKAELGAKIAEDTAVSLEKIVSGINESNQLVSDIALSSDEQSRGIAEINSGIDQVAQVVQQNSATAQESAASAQTLNSQSDALEALVGRFTLRNSGGKRLGQGALGAARPARPAQASPFADMPSLTDGGFGKY